MDITFSGSVLFAAAVDGIYKSTDNGTTWTAVKIFAAQCYTVFVDGTNIYAGGIFNGIYRSSNDGATWSLISLPEFNSVALDFTKLGTDLYVSTYDGVYKSTDNGLTWLTTNNGMPSAATPTSIIAHNGNLFVSTYAGIYKSTDNAANWTKVYNSVNDTGSLAAIGENIFMATRQGVLTTSNGGSLWSFVNNGLTGTEITSFLAKGNELFCGTRGNGVFRSSDGGASWMPWGFGSIHQDVTALALNGSTILAGTDLGSGLYQWTENAFQWSPVIAPFKQVRSLAVIDGNIYIGTFQNTYRSENNGSSWTEVNTGLPQDHTVKSFVAIGANIFAGARGNNGGGFYRLHENETEWILANANLPTPIQVQHLLGKNDTLYAATSNGVFRSIDTGENWTIFGSNTLNGHYLAEADEYLVLAALDGVYFSPVATPNWVKLDKGFPYSDMVVQTLSINGDKLLAGSDASGVWSMDINELSNLVTSTAEVSQQMLIAYPNPATKKIHIRLHAQELQRETSIEIYDVQGRQQSTDFIREGSDIVADINNFSNGIYIVKVIHQHTATYIKFLKQ